MPDAEDVAEDVKGPGPDNAPVTDDAPVSEDAPLSEDAKEKDVIRKAALENRLARPENPRDAYVFVQRFHEGLQSRLELEPDTVVAGYWAVRGEADPSMLLEYLRGLGCLIALPRHDPETREINFPIWVADTPLVEGKNGIYMPPPNVRLLMPQILIVPLLAFDRQGHRIGYGSGYYDRLFRLWSDKARSVVTIGLAFHDQEVERIPSEPHDRPLQWILTDESVIKA